MAENNNEPVKLASLTTATAADVKDAMSGQPESVKDESVFDLGSLADYQYDADEDGTKGFYNPMDVNIGMDFDQFRTQGEILGGNVSRVKKLDQGFTYTGLEDTYNRSQEAQGSLQKLRNGFMQLVGDTGINIAQGFAMIPGAINAVAQGDLTKAYDNALSNSMDTMQEDYGKFFDISRGGNQSGVQKATNFFADDLLGGVSFILGAVGTELAMTALSTVSLGALAPAQGAASIGLVARGARQVKKIVNGGRSVMRGNVIDDAAKALAPMADDVTRASAVKGIDAASDVALADRRIDATSKLARQILTGAGMESGMEARHMLNEAVEAQRRNYELANGPNTFTDEMAASFREEISGYGDAVFGMNLVLVGASNMMMFPKLFGVGMRRGMRTSKFIDTSSMSVKARSRLAKRMGLEVDKLPKIIDRTRGTRMGRLGRAVNPNTGVIGRSLYEGVVEEGGQGTISRAYKSYIEHKYDPTGQKKAIGSLESMLDGLEGSYTTAEGLKEVAIGMLLGGFGVPNVFRVANAEGNTSFLMGGLSDTRAQNRVKDNQLDRLINLTESNGDINAILKHELENHVVQQGIQADLDEAVVAGDFALAKDLESRSVFAHGTSKILTGRFEDALVEAAEILENMSVEELQEALGPEAKNMTKSELRDHRSSVLQSYTARMNRVRDAYDHMQSIYMENNHDVQVNIAELVYDIADRDAREQAIAGKLTETLKKYGAEEIIGATRLRAELELTDEQINSLKASSEKIRRIEKQLETKRERNLIKNVDPEKAKKRTLETERLEKELQSAREARSKILKTISVQKNLGNKYDFDTDEMQERVETVIDLYVAVSEQSEASDSENTLPFSTSEAKQSLQEDFNDMSRLAADRKEMIEIYNDLIKPGGYDRFIERMEKTINALHIADWLNQKDRVQNDEDQEEENVESPSDTPKSKKTESRGDVNQDDRAPASDIDQEDKGPLSDLSDRNKPEAPKDDVAVEEDEPGVVAGRPASDKPVGKGEESGSTPKNQYSLFENDDTDDTDPPAGGAVGPGGSEVVLNLAFDALSRAVRQKLEQGFQGLHEDIAKGDYAPVEMSYNDAGNLVFKYKNNTIAEFWNAEDRAFADEIYDTLPPSVRAVFGPNMGSARVSLDVVTVDTVSGYDVKSEDQGKPVRNSVAGKDVDTIQYWRETEKNQELLSVKGSVKTPRLFASLQPGQSMVVVKGVPFRTQGRPLTMSKAQALYNMWQVMDALVNNTQTVQSLTDSNFKRLQTIMENQYDMDFTLGETEVQAAFMRNILNQYTMPSKNTKTQDRSPNTSKTSGVRIQFVKGDLQVIDYSLRNEEGRPPVYKASTSGKKPLFQKNFLVALSKASHTITGNMAGNPITLVNSRQGGYDIETKDALEHTLDNFTLTERAPVLQGGDTKVNVPTKIRLRFSGQSTQPSTTQPNTTTPTTGRIEDDLDGIEEQYGQDVDAPQEIGSNEELEAQQEAESKSLRDQRAREITDQNALDRANSLYLIEGLSVKDTQDAINVVTGDIATLMLIHMKTKDRYKRVSANEITRKVRKKLETMRNGLAQRGLTEMERVHNVILQPENFDKLIKLSLMEMMRIQKGVVNVSQDFLTKSLDDVMSDTQKTLEDEVLEETAEHLDRESEKGMKAFDDNFAFGVNPANTLRLELKLAMMTVRHSRSYRNTQTVGKFGLKYMDFNTLSGQLNMLLSDRGASWKLMQEVLEANTYKLPYLQSVLDMLNPDLISRDDLSPFTQEKLYPNNQAFENAKDSVRQMRQQFVVYAAKDQANFIGVKVYLGKKKRLFQTNSNDRDMLDFAMQDLRAQLYQKNIYKKDTTTNEYSVDQDVVRAILEKLDNVVTEVEQGKRAAAMARLLSTELGIELDSAYLSNNRDLEETTGTNSHFGRMRAHLRSYLSDEADLNKNLLDGVNNPLKTFIENTLPYRQNLIQNTSKDGNNNLRWQYVAGKHLSSELRRVLNSEEEMNNPLVRDMRDANLRSSVRIDYLDNINKARTGRRGRDFHGMEIADRLITRLKLYGNENTTRSGRHMVRMFMPTLSDKGTMPVIQVPSMRNTMRISVDNISKPVNELTIADFTGNTKALYKASMQDAIQDELVRIKRIKVNREEEAAGVPWNERSNQQSDMDPLDDKQLQADYFVLMPSLNLIAQEYMEGGIDEAQFQEKVHKQAQGDFEQAVTADIREILEVLDEHIFVRNDEGVITGGKYFLPLQGTQGRAQNRFVAELNGTDVSELKSPEERYAAMLAFVAKFAVEGIRTNTNIVTAMLGDVGAFHKKDATGTAINMGKRFAGLIAPGSVIPTVSWRMDGLTKTNEVIRSLIIPERINQASHMEFLKKLGLTESELGTYGSYDSADAAEYTTAEEHLSILYAQGKIRRREFLGLLKKSKDPNAVFTDTEKKAWFQPMKPVATGKQGGRMVYIKSASFPLVASMTKDTELDKLRVFMEEHDIQRAAHTSAVKVGQTVHDIFDTERSIYTKDGGIDVEDSLNRFGIGKDANGKVVTDSARSQVIEYPRDFMRIQQEVPANRGASKIHGSQAAKLILVDLAESRYKFELNGEAIDGKALQQRYIKARREESIARLIIFADKYGLSYKELDSGDVRLIRTPDYKKKISDAIRREAVERGYDLNEIADLHINEQGDFAVPLTMGTSRTRVEQLLMSLIRKQVYESRVQGYSGPIRPEPGIKLLKDFDKNAITWVVDKDNNRLYDGNKLTTQEGKKPDQIVMPWKFKQSIAPYIDKDTNTISLERIPREILQTFAYRIPGQGKNSSATFEIVGFLPKEYGDTLIVPEELVARIGQDYDIDKMFGMLYELEEYGPKSNLSLRVIREQDAKKGEPSTRASIARNTALDIYNASMRSEDAEVQRAIHRPVSDGYAVSLAGHISKSRMILETPMSVMYNERKADAARSSKSAIGVLADANVMHAQLQQSGEHLVVGKQMPSGALMYDVPIYEYNEEEDEDVMIIPASVQMTLGKREILDKNFVFKYGETPQAGTISNQFSRLLNHAVDNENNQMLSRLGISGAAYDIWTGMTHMGFNQETIAILINTPVVQEYLKRVEGVRSLVNETYINPDGILSEMFSERLTSMEEVPVDGSPRIKDVDSRVLDGRIPKDLLVQLFNGDTNGMTADSIDQLEMNILSAIGNLRSFDMTMKKFQNFMRLDTKTPKTQTELLVRRGRALQFMEKKRGLLAGEPYNLLSSTVAGLVFDLDVNFGNRLLNLENESIYETRLMGAVINMFVDDEFADFSDADTYLKGVMQYLSIEHALDVQQQFEKVETPDTAEPAYTNTGRALRSRLLGQNEGQESMAEQIVRVRGNNKELDNNLFLRHLEIHVAPVEGYPRVEFLGDRTINTSSLEMQQAFISMARSPKLEVRELAKDLYLYYLVTKGTLSSRGFGKYIPSEYRQYWNLRNTITPSSVTLNFPQEHISQTVVHDMVMRHNPGLAPFVSSDTKFRQVEIPGELVQGGEAIMVQYVPTDEIPPAALQRMFLRRKGKLFRIKQVVKGSDVFEDSKYEEVALLEEVSTFGDYISDEYEVNHRHEPAYKGLDLTKRSAAAQLQAQTKNAMKLDNMLSPQTRKGIKEGKINEIRLQVQTRNGQLHRMPDGTYRVGEKPFRLTFKSMDGNIAVYDLVERTVDDTRPAMESKDLNPTTTQAGNDSDTSEAGSDVDAESRVGEASRIAAKEDLLRKIEERRSALKRKGDPVKKQEDPVQPKAPVKDSVEKESTEQKAGQVDRSEEVTDQSQVSSETEIVHNKQTYRVTYEGLGGVNKIVNVKTGKEINSTSPIGSAVMDKWAQLTEQKENQEAASKVKTAELSNEEAQEQYETKIAKLNKIRRDLSEAEDQGLTEVVDDLVQAIEELNDEIDQLGALYDIDYSKLEKQESDRGWNNQFLAMDTLKKFVENDGVSLSDLLEALDVVKPMMSEMNEDMAVEFGTMIAMVIQEGRGNEAVPVMIEMLRENMSTSAKVQAVADALQSSFEMKVGMSINNYVASQGQNTAEETDTSATKPNLEVRPRQFRHLKNGTYSVKEIRDIIKNSVGSDIMRFAGLLDVMLDRFENTANFGGKPLQVAIIREIRDKKPGMYTPSDHTITLNLAYNLGMASQVSPGQSVGARTFVHELVHAGTLESIHAVQNGQQVTKEVRESVKALERLREQIVRDPVILKTMGLSMEGLQQYTRGMKLNNAVNAGRRLRETLNAQEKADLEFIGKNIVYYGLVGSKPGTTAERSSALYEFAAEVMANPILAEALSRVKISKTESFLQRIVRKLVDIMNSYGFKLGDNYRDIAQAAVLTVMEAQTNTDLGSGNTSLANEVANAPTESATSRMGELVASDIDALVAYKRKRVKEFNELRARFIDNGAFVKTLNQRISQEEAELEMLTRDDDSVSLTDVVNMAEREIADIEDAMGRVRTTGKSLDVHQAVLQNLFSTIQFYDQVRDIVKRTPEARKALRDVQARAGVLREDYLWHAREMLRTYAKQRFKGKKAQEFIDSDSFENMKNINSVVSRFMDASRMGRIEFSYIDTIVRDAVMAQQAEFTDRMNRWRDVSEPFKKTRFFKKYGWEGLVQPDVKGDPTNQLITPISSTFVAAYGAARENFLGKGRNPQAMDNWLRSNTGTIDLSVKFKIVDSEVEVLENAAYDRMMEGKFGKSTYKEMLASQTKRLEEYVLARQAITDAVEGNESDENIRRVAIMNWERGNDPFAFQEYLSGKSKKRPKGANGNYLELIPLRMKNGVATGYYNKRFEELESEPEANAVYLHYRNEMQEMMRRLPLHEMRDRAIMENGLFIPAIRKKLTENLLEGGITGMIAKAHDGMLRALTVTEDDMKAYLIDPVTGNKREQLPLYFMNKLADMSQQDFDLDRVFAGFTMMATTYAAKNDIEDLVKMTDSVMGSVNITHTDSWGRKLLGKFGVTMASRDGRSSGNVQTVMQMLMDQFYGRPRKKVLAGKAKRLMTKDQRREYKELDKQIKALGKDDPLRKELEDKQQALVPNVEAGKVVYNVQQWVQAKGMGWNIPAATTNWVFGTAAVFKHAAGEADFTTKDARKANAIMSNATLNAISLNYAIDNLPVAQKIQNMMVRMDVLKDFTEIRFDQSEVVKRATQSGSKAVNRKGINKLRMYEIQRSSEYYVYGISTISLLLSEQVNGKSLWEQMNNEGIIDVDGYRPGEAKLMELIAKSDQINKRIHGNYDPNSPIAMKKTLAGGLLMQFRSWLPEAIAARFEGERYDLYLDRDVKGTFRTMFGEEMGTHWANMLRVGMPIRSLQGEMSPEIKAVDQENIRKFAASLRQWIGILLLQAFLRSLYDDEDEEGKYALNFMMNVASRVENDMSTFGNPYSAYKLTKDPFAALGAVEDIFAFLDATAHTVQGDPTIPSGVHAGKSRMGYHGSKLIPAPAAVNKLYNNTNRVLNLKGS